jgi:hypothetical protein
MRSGHAAAGAPAGRIAGCRFREPACDLNRWRSRRRLEVRCCPDVPHHTGDPAEHIILGSRPTEGPEVLVHSSDTTSAGEAARFVSEANETDREPMAIHLRQDVQRYCQGPVEVMRDRETMVASSVEMGHARQDKTAMLATQKTRMIETLQDTMDELCSADLTLARAKALRCRLLALLEGLEAHNEGTTVEPMTER